MDRKLLDLQRAVCRRFGVRHYSAPAAMLLGIAENVNQGLVPLNGLRHPRRAILLGGTSGPVRNFQRRSISFGHCMSPTSLSGVRR